VIDGLYGCNIVEGGVLSVFVMCGESSGVMEGKLKLWRGYLAGARELATSSQDCQA
jgi:hypothetical protein